MKKLVLAFIIVLITAAFVFAQTEIAAEDTATSAEPQVSEQPEVIPAAPESVVQTPEAPALETATAPVAEQPIAETAPVALPETTVTIPATAEAPAEALALKGYIIDNQCAGTQTAEQLSLFVLSHPKACALLPECAASGYSIFADNVLYKFDKDSSVKVEEFLKQENSKLLVTVVAKKVGEELNLVSIENQQ